MAICNQEELLLLLLLLLKSLQLCPTLCDPRDGSPPGSTVPGILQARTLEWIAISFSNAWKWKVKVKLFSRVRLSDRMDCSLSGSSVHGIFQARVLTGVGCHSLLPTRKRLLTKTLSIIFLFIFKVFLTKWPLDCGGPNASLAYVSKPNLSQSECNHIWESEG